MIKRIFDNVIHKQVSSLQQELYGGLTMNKTKYLILAFNIFGEKLNNYFENDYIFGKVYYRKDIDKSPEIVDFFQKEPFSNTSTIFSQGIKQLENLVESGNSKSLSIVIIERFLRGIVLYRGEKPIRIPSFLDYNMDENLIKKFWKELDNYSLVAKSKKILTKNEKNGIKNLLDGHREMSIQSNLDSIYSYLIRTRTFADDYNGVLYLVLKRSLTVQEYSEIADLLTFIREVDIKYYYKPKVQQEEWQLLMQQQAHVNQTELKALRNMITKLNQIRLDDDMFKLTFKKTDNYVDDLSERNLMVLFMGRYKNSQDLNSQNDSRGIPIATKEVNVTKILKEKVKAIEDSLTVITENEEKNTLFLEQTIPNLKIMIKNLPNIYSNIRPPGLGILFIERLKNAFYFTNNKNPVVEILHNEDKDYHYIHFINNQSIEFRDYELIKNGRSPNHEAGSYRNKFGERFIREIVDHELFCADGKWGIDIEESSTDISLQKTDIFFKIPKIKQT